MLATTLMVAALFGSPFTPRAVVPVSSPMVAITATPSTFDPQASARASKTVIVVVASVVGTVSVDVLTQAGTVYGNLVAATPVTAGSVTTVNWDAAGAADGPYGIRVALVDATGLTSQSLTSVVVDSTAPVVRFAALGSGRTAVGPIAIKATARDVTPLARITLTVESQLGAFLGTVNVPVSSDGRGAALDWNLRLRKRLLQPGVYHLRLTGVDGAGNVGESKERLLRVDRAVKNNVIYSLRKAGRVIGLAFDDCVSEQAWLSIIKSFRAAKAHTTFFCNGVNVRSNPTAARATLAGGHTIGSHTWAHPQMPKLSASAQISQLKGDKEIWWRVAKASPMPFFRPPYGLRSATTDAAAGTEGFAYSVLWDVDPSDYLNPPPRVLVDRITRNARPGSIVVLHVNANTAAAVPELIRALRRRGLEPQSLDEMFGVAAYLAARKR
jgi:peptidoglycan/xylan/chitin deacetylase (PgdA/CDA1 family)